jgi:hypothetical protein
MPHNRPRGLCHAGKDAMQPILPGLSVSGGRSVVTTEAEGQMPGLEQRLAQLIWLGRGTICLSGATLLQLAVNSRCYVFFLLK